MSRTKHLLFKLEAKDDWAEATYHRKPDDPLYNPRDPFGELDPTRTDDVYRVSAHYFNDERDFAICMQHLNVGKKEGEMPGRLVEMTREQFSQFVDALVALRDKVRP